MKTRLVFLSLVLSTVAYAQGVGYGLSSSAGAGSGVSTAIQKGDGAGGFTPAVTDTDFASTSYVGTQVSGLYWKQACKYATNAALATNVYANGSSGVGATLTGFAFGAVSVDGSTPSVGDRILVKNETAGANNGVYTVTAVGSGAAFYILTRATDFDQTAEINNGDTVPIISGTANTESNWTLTSGGVPTMGSTTLTLTRQIDSTIVTLTGSQTLTNKTLTSPVLTTPDIGTPSAGVGTNFSGTASNLTAGKATAVAGGSGGTVSYQSSADTTAFLANGTAGYRLKAGGGTAAPAWQAEIGIVTATFDGGGSTLTTGKAKGYFTCPYSGSITGWSISADAGTATVDVWKIAAGTAVPTTSNKITTNGVSLSSGTSVHSNTVSDFSTTVTANDIIAVNLTTVATATELTFELEITKN